MNCNLVDNVIEKARIIYQKCWNVYIDSKIINKQQLEEVEWSKNTGISYEESQQGGLDIKLFFQNKIKL